MATLRPKRAKQERRLKTLTKKKVNPTGRASAADEISISMGVQEGTSVENIPIGKIDLEDRTFQFRAKLQIFELEQSIQENGQQIPVVLRKRGRSYQLVSGFRRVTALKNLGVPTAAAIIRSDLKDDEAAFAAAVLENTARKSYNDIDRALVIERYEKLGYSSFEIGPLMGLTQRQKNNLVALLTFTKGVQNAIIKEGTFSTTHALTLKKLKGIYPNLSYGKWITRINKDGLSVDQTTRAVNAEYKEEGEQKLPSMFKVAQAKKGIFRLSPIKLDLKVLTDEDKKQLADELNQLLKAITLS